MLNFELNEEYIELFKLLKILRIAQTGGHAKLMIENGEVKLNGETEFRKRAKIRKGCTVDCQGQTIQIS
jgi:ribosome-associated protein